MHIWNTILVIVCISQKGCMVATLVGGDIFLIASTDLVDVHFRPMICPMICQ